VTVAPNDLPATLSSEETASLLGINSQVLCRMQHSDAAGSDRYPKAAFRIGRRYRFRADDIARFMSGTK